MKRAQIILQLITINKIKNNIVYWYGLTENSRGYKKQQTYDSTVQTVANMAVRLSDLKLLQAYIPKRARARHSFVTRTFLVQTKTFTRPCVVKTKKTFTRPRVVKTSLDRV